MAKIAKLVSYVLTTRVVVDENATNEEIAKAALPRVMKQILNDELPENLDQIINDTECPYDSDIDN